MLLCHNFSKQFFPFNSQFGSCYIKKKKIKEHKYSQQNSKLKVRTEF